MERKEDFGEKYERVCDHPVVVGFLAVKDEHVLTYNYFQLARHLYVIVHLLRGE